MLKTVRETLASLKDKSYGNIIVSQSLGSSLWYWTKYLLVFTIIPWVVFVLMLTYFLPQLPRALRENLPDAQIALRNGHFSTSLPDGSHFGDKSFSLVINTQATDSSVLKEYDSGVLIASSAAYVRSSDGTSDYSHYPQNINFTVSKSQVVSWVSSHQGQIWLGSFVALTLLAAFMSTLYWVYSLFLYALGGLALWLVARVSRRQLNIAGAMKLSIYASILPFLVGTLFSVSSNSLIVLVLLVIYFYLGYTWIQNLPLLSSSKTK